MRPIITGLVYVLGDDVDTDQIIPAQHLSIPVSDPASRRRYGALALSGVPDGQAGLPGGRVPFIDPATQRSPFRIILAGRNFGCGSSREHAPLSLKEAGIGAVVALSYARIFFRNAIDGGYFPPFESATALGQAFVTGDEAVVDCQKGELVHQASGARFPLRDLGPAADIVFLGGIFPYARKHRLMGGSLPPE